MSSMYCITCPTGCRLTVTGEGAEIVVEGNGCKRGVDFAFNEINNPTRSLTTTVRTTIPEFPVLPVRTDGEIPKAKIMEAMRALGNVVINRPLECGDTVLGNLVGTGVRVIATGNMLRFEPAQVKKPDIQHTDEEQPAEADVESETGDTAQAEAEAEESKKPPAEEERSSRRRRARLGPS